MSNFLLDTSSVLLYTPWTSYLHPFLDPVDSQESQAGGAPQPLDEKEEDMVRLSSAETVNSQAVDVTPLDGTAMIDGATMITTDIEATNGVIHVIDRVTLP